MIRTSIVVAVLLLAGACASVKPVSSPALLSPRISVNEVSVSASSRSLSGPSEASVRSLPLYGLLASAAAEEFAAVGLDREAAIPVLEKSIWRLHRWVTVSERRNNDTEKVVSEGFWPMLNISFLSTGDAEIGMDNLLPERLHASLQQYQEGVSAGVSIAGDAFFETLGLTPVWTVSSTLPTIGEGRVAVIVTAKSVRYRLPVWRFSPLVGDLWEITDTVAWRTGATWSADVQWMEGEHVPKRVINYFIQKRFEESVSRDLFVGIGIDSAKRSPYAVIIAMGTESAAVGDTVTVQAARGRDATGSYTIDKGDMVEEEDGRIFVQTSGGPEEDEEVLRILGRAARLAGKKLAGTQRPPSR